MPLGKPDDVVLSGNGRRVAAVPGIEGCAVSVWRIPLEPRPACFHQQVRTGFKLSVALSYSGRVLATSDAAGEVRFWDTQRATPLGRSVSLQVARPVDDFGLGEEPASLAFAPDDRTLATMDTDRSRLHFIDVAERQTLGSPLRVVSGLASELSMSFSPNSERLVISAGGEAGSGVVEVNRLAWSRDLAFLRQRICQVAGYGLSAAQWRELKIPSPYARQC